MMHGTVLNQRYQLGEQIGMGGMGVVYRATDLRTGGQVAVKIPHAPLVDDPVYRARLRREANLAAALSSPRVVRIVDLDVDGSPPFLVMEYVAGETLHDYLNRQGRLAHAEATRIALEIARALEAAAAQGVVHRDLKPHNVKLVDGHIKVLDFGIARADGIAGLTATSGFVGTPEYAAPERAAGEGDVRADVYSLGVMLYEMLAGRRPFGGSTPVAVLLEHQRTPPPALPAEVPAALAAIVERCLAKAAADRFQTPAALIAALLEAGSGTPASSPLPRTLDFVPKASVTGQLGVGVGVGVGAGALAALGWLVGGALEPALLGATVDVLEFDSAAALGRLSGGALASLVTALAFGVAGAPRARAWKALAMAMLGGCAGALAAVPIQGPSAGAALGAVLGALLGSWLVAFGFRWRVPPSPALQLALIALGAAIIGSVLGGVLEPISLSPGSVLEEWSGKLFAGLLGAAAGALLATAASVWSNRVAWPRVLAVASGCALAWTLGHSLGPLLALPLWLAIGLALVAWQVLARPRTVDDAAARGR